MLCDDEGCRASLHGRNVAILHSRSAFFEDWDWADVMIGDIPLPEEKAGSGKVVLGLYDFLDHGAHTVSLSGARIRVRSVGEDMGERPWSE
jgi:hypothetical protein